MNNRREVEDLNGGKFRYAKEEEERGETGVVEAIAGLREGNMLRFADFKIKTLMADGPLLQNCRQGILFAFLEQVLRG